MEGTMIDHSNSGALSEEMIDRILADSFPASDPPPWTVGRENQCCSGVIGDSKETNEKMNTSDIESSRLLD
jgi:hypothetical protein